MHQHTHELRSVVKDGRLTLVCEAPGCIWRHEARDSTQRETESTLQAGEVHQWIRNGNDGR